MCPPPVPRGPRSFPLWACALLLLSALPAAAQDVDCLTRLDRDGRYAVEIVLDSARVLSLPDRVLRSKACEGIAKKAPDRKIVDEVRKQFGFLRTAQQLLGTVGDEELAAAGAVLQAGAKPAQLTVFKPRQKGRADLEAFTVWADLITRGVPSEDAYSAITKLWQDGADGATFLTLWNNVQADISQGLNPGAALQNRIRETPGGGRTPPKPTPPDGQQENQRSR